MRAASFLLVFAMVVPAQAWSGVAKNETVEIRSLTEFSGQNLSFPAKLFVAKFPDQDPSIPATQVELVSFQDYIAGVVFKEALRPDNLTIKQATNLFKAQAIASQTIFQFRILDNKKRALKGKPPLFIVKRDGKPAVFNTTRFQEFNVTKDSLTKTVAALKDVKNKVLSYDGRVIDAQFTAFSASGFTQSSETSENLGTFQYLPYLRRQASPGEPPTPSSKAKGGNHVGMSQRGAIVMVRRDNKNTFRDILEHYYHSAPPYAKRVIVRQGGSELRDVHNIIIFS